MNKSSSTEGANSISVPETEEEFRDRQMQWLKNLPSLEELRAQVGEFTTEEQAMIDEIEAELERNPPPRDSEFAERVLQLMRDQGRLSE